MLAAALGAGHVPLADVAAVSWVVLGPRGRIWEVAVSVEDLAAWALAGAAGLPTLLFHRGCGVPGFLFGAELRPHAVWTALLAAAGRVDDAGVRWVSLAVAAEALLAGNSGITSLRKKLAAAAVKYGPAPRGKRDREGGLLYAELGALAALFPQYPPPWPQ